MLGSPPRIPETHGMSRVYIEINKQNPKMTSWASVLDYMTVFDSHPPCVHTLATVL
jgi:hypothetical protein